MLIHILFQTNDDELDFSRKLYQISQNVAEESVARLMDWYRLQPHFPEIELEKRFVYRILAVNEYSVEKTKEKIENYFSARSIMPEFFADRDPCNVKFQRVFDVADWILMPRLTPERHRICMLRMKNEDVNLFDAETTYKVIFMMCDMRMRYDTSLGDIFVWDGANAQLGHIVKTTPTLIKKVLFLIEKCYGAKMKGFHIINCPAYAHNIINFAKSIMKGKLAKRVYIHKTLKELHEHIPIKCLPKEYGGNTLETCSQIADNWKRAFKSDEWRKWLVESEMLKSDDSKKINDDDNIADSLLGIRGTFRKLDID
ncbi:alpha-tocopherol transfer protein-like isoform X2 [Arctopsyche grandis]|uniref:alpha-tocopherol transfer protein-like isoform X2 n=1 Tax=Arctopsyche grandis TaxID=121162 RepID=UPI00406D8F16